MARSNFEKLRVYQLAEALGHEIWNLVICWDSFCKETLGKQIVKSANGIGANIAEGTGRGSYQDNRRFIRIARGSLYETQHWLRQTFKRNLLAAKKVNIIKPIVDELSPKLNAYLKSIGKNSEKRNGNKQQRTTDH